jgi:hypothetical protein
MYIAHIVHTYILKILLSMFVNKYLHSIIVYAIVLHDIIYVHDVIVNYEAYMPLT